MPRKNKEKEKTEKSVIKKEIKQLTGVPAFIKQNSLQTVVVTLHDMRISIPTTVAPAVIAENAKAAFLNANGFTQFSATGALLLQAVPQEALFDQYAAMYEYYVPEVITLRWIPTRIQFDVNQTNLNQDVYQAPTIMGTLPTSDTLNQFTPVDQPLDIISRCRQLCARTLPQIVKGDQSCSKTIDLLDNLLSRQDTPMLRTNGSAGARDQYAQPDLVSIVNLINTASLSRVTLGYYIFSVRYRFAGRINPTVPSVDDMISLASSNTQIQSQQVPPISQFTQLMSQRR